MNQVTCFRCSMHGCCISSEYEPQNMKYYTKILAMCHAGSRHLQCGLIDKDWDS